MNELLTVIYKGSTIVIMDAASNVIAAGTPKAVGDTLKARFAAAIHASKHGAANAEADSTGLVNVGGGL